MKMKIFLIGLMVTMLIVLTGCKLPWGGAAEQVGKQASKSSENYFGQYVKAENSFNEAAVAFAFAENPSLAKMRSGQPLTSVSVPNYDSLNTSLTQLKDKSSGYEDLDASRDKLLDILKDLAPLTSQMKGYYDSKSYTQDNNQKGTEYVQKYLALHDQFTAEWKTFGELIKKYNRERKTAKIEEMKADNKVNAVTFLENNLLLETVMAEVKANDQSQLNANLATIMDNVGKLTAANNPKLKSYITQVNNFVGDVRGGRKLNDIIKAYNNVINAGNQVDIKTLDN